MKCGRVISLEMFYFAWRGKKKIIAQSNLVLVVTVTAVQWEAFPPESITFRFVATFILTFSSITWNNQWDNVTLY